MALVCCVQSLLFQKVSYLFWDTPSSTGDSENEYKKKKGWLHKINRKNILGPSTVVLTFSVIFKFKKKIQAILKISLIIHKLVQKYSGLPDYISVSRCLEAPEEGTGSFGYILQG